GMLQVEPVDVGSPQDSRVRLSWTAPPQPQAFRDARLARQPLDLHEHDGAWHGGLGAVGAFGRMVVGLGMHAGPGADPHLTVLSVLLAELRGRLPPGRLVVTDQLPAVPS